MSGSWQDVLGAQLAREAFFDQGVEAARNACVAGAPLAAAAITAAAYYQNPLNGIDALHACMARFADGPPSVTAFRESLRRQALGAGDAAGLPGFGFVSVTVAAAVRDAAASMLALDGLVFPRLSRWHRLATETTFGIETLNPAGLVALCGLDQGMAPSDAERCYLLWRLAPALREAQRARARGLQQFPFFENAYVYEGEWPARRTAGLDAGAGLPALMEALQLDR